MKKTVKVGIVALVILVILAVMVIMPGCKTEGAVPTKKALEENTESREAETIEEDEAEEKMTEEIEKPVEEPPKITVTDGEGNVVELDIPAEKVIVLAPSVLEIIDGLGAMDKVSEIDNFTVMMQEPLAEGFKGVGDYQGLNIEIITELDPDIIIAITGGPDDDYQKVGELGIQIYRV